MSKPLQMEDCPLCSHPVLLRNGTKILISSGIIRRPFNGGYIEDICERCGGSGRISTMKQKMYDRKTIMLSRKQKVDMREWIAKEKELVYGAKE